MITISLCGPLKPSVYEHYDKGLGVFVGREGKTQVLI